MNIEAVDLAKRFNKDWLFRRLTYRFEAGNFYAIIGVNGSGKSTLMQILWGSLPPTLGKVTYTLPTGRVVGTEQAYTAVAIVAPYVGLIDEYTLQESIRFHFKFKPLMPQISLSDIPDILGLRKHQHKKIGYFSSGMRQRVKLVLAFLSAVPCLFMDEPCANLDAQGIAWYHRLLADYTHDKIIIIASNQMFEYPETAQILRVSDYAQKKTQN